MLTEELPIAEQVARRKYCQGTFRKLDNGSACPAQGTARCRYASRCWLSYRGQLGDQRSSTPLGSPTASATLSVPDDPAFVTAWTKMLIPT
jgi:hypothetical protein